MAALDFRLRDVAAAGAQHVTPTPAKPGRPDLPRIGDRPGLGEESTQLQKIVVSILKDWA